MKLAAFSMSRRWSRSLPFIPLAAAALFAVSVAPSYAGHPAAHGPAAKAAPQALPDVKLPYTFVCPDCGLKITIKTPADWNKDCFMCACGKKNIGCYHDRKK